MGGGGNAEGQGPGSGLVGELCTHKDRWTGETLHGQWGLRARDATCPSHMVGQPRLPPATPSWRTRGCSAACCPAQVSLGHKGCSKAQCCAGQVSGISSCTQPLPHWCPGLPARPALSSVRPCYSVQHLHLTCAVCNPPTAVHTSMGTLSWPHDPSHPSLRRGQARTFF